MKIFSLILLFCFVNIAANAQDGKLQSSQKSREPASFIDVPAALKNRTEDFFRSIANNEIKQAYDKILINSPISRQKEDLENLISQTKKAIDIYGNIEGFEPVNAEIAAESYIRLRYLGLHSNFPVRWVFTYYKAPEKGWIVTNIKFDDLSENYFKGD